MTHDPEWRPLTDEQRRLAEEVQQWALEQVREAEKRPKPPVTSPGKFTEPLGLDEDGNLQPPLTAEEAAHNEAVRRRGRNAAAAAGDESSDDEPGPGDRGRPE